MQLIESTINLLKIRESSKWLQHLLFWAGLWLLLVILDKNDGGVLVQMIREAINTGLYALIFYGNRNLLFQKFLPEKSKVYNFQFWKYFLPGAVILILVYTILKAIFLYGFFPFALNKIQVESFIGIFLTGTLFFIASTEFLVIRDWLKNITEKRELESRQLESELRFLKSQVNPHFLFNTLNSLYALALKKSDKTPEIVLKLSEMMRYMLYECNEPTVYLEKEIKYLGNYLELEKLRVSEKVDIKFSVDGDPSKLKIAPLIFIAFIENCFKHGVMAIHGNAYVHIRLDIVEDSVQLNVQNSKPDSIPLGRYSPSGGIGLGNVKKRLELLYPNMYSLDIKNEPDKYSVELYIDLKQSTNEN
jgi:two-component system, LytTR family, sensor kinase